MKKELRLHLSTIARRVRDWAEEEDNRREFPTKDLNGWCAIAAAQLSRELKREEIDHEIHMAEDSMGCHVFVVVSDHVVDVTATQFMKFGKTSIVIEHLKELAEYWYYQTAHIFKTPEELRKYQKRVGWPSNQIARKK